MSATGRSDVRRPDDFYSTPAWCVRAILPELPNEGILFDPCAGDGAILAAVREEQPSRVLLGLELSATRVMRAGLRSLPVIEGDALDEQTWKGTCGSNLRVVLTNPPYSLAEEFLCRALDEFGFAPDGMLRGTVCLLLRLNWLASQSRAWLHKKHPSDVFVLPRRPSFVNGRTDATEYGWFVWGPGRGGHWRILDVEGIQNRFQKAGVP